MSKRVAVIIIVVVAVGVLSAIMIARYASTPGSIDSLSGKAITRTGETGSAVPEVVTGTDKASTASDMGAAGRAKRKAPAVARKSGAHRKSAGASVIESAAAADKYTFIFFYSDESEQTQSERAAFRMAMSRITEKAVPLEIDTNDPTEIRIVNEFQVSRAPMPLVLAVAPNGAITGGFPQEFEETQLLGAFASPCEEKSLKALQERRVVLVCVQNGSTKTNDAAMKGVQDFKADPNFGPSTEIVMLDPADPSEAEFLEALQVAAQTHEAVTVCVVPPGRAVARFTGATRKETIVAALSSSKGCGPGGCGPGGCGQ
jgi:hypothetical protein